jgi:DTW domain-containing protein YfiP
MIAHRTHVVLSTLALASVAVAVIARGALLPRPRRCHQAISLCLNASLSGAFATLCVILADSKIKRREAMERQLAEIEKDIRTLERGDVVLIVPDNGNGYGGCQYDC